MIIEILAKAGVVLRVKRVVFACIVVGCFAVASLSPEPASAVGEAAFSTSPKANHGKRWRIAYYEGGSHGNYYEYLRAVVDGLMTLGWIEARSIPNHASKSSQALWEWLSNTRSRYVKFKRDAFYSAGWDTAVRRSQRDEVVARLNRKGDIDLVLAFGTWAGKDLATDAHKVPTIVSNHKIHAD